MKVPGLACLFLLSPAAFLANAQTPPVPNQPRLEFEVASVKPTGPQHGRSIGCWTYPGGRVVISNETLEMLILEAFDIQPFQLSGGPVWMRDFESRYEIEARSPATSKSNKANPSTAKAPLNEEQREMLQSLLIDRFQLQFHRETRQGPVYLLTLGKKDLKLKEVKDKGEFEWVGSPKGGPIVGDGLAGENISMPVLAQRLSEYLEHPVFDKTGLKGFFDFKQEYAADDAHPDIVSCILTSIEGIGLKLKSAKGPVETIIIDHAEKPSAN